MRTYEKYLDLSSLHEFIVVTPREEVQKLSALLKNAYPSWPWKFIIEEALVSNRIPDGWAKQQTAKLAVANVVKTQHYLIIDDDTYLTKPFSYTNMFHNGKLIMNKTQIDFPFFFLWSAQVAQVDYDLVQNADYHMAITPEIFDTNIVKEIVNWLESEYGTQMKWQEYLAENKYTEYCLYWIYLIKTHRCHEVYASDADAPQVYGYPTSGPEHNLEEQVKKSFMNNEQHYFSFVQSSLQFTVPQVEAVVEALLQYLPGN
jgi:hypothetical protein